METRPDSTRWDPAQYRRYADERLRPALELLDRVPLDSPRTVYDLGCGTGNVTRLLAARWPHARVVGLDHSPEMLSAARESDPEGTWLEADVATWAPDAPADLLYSNATLHWLGDHAALFPRLASFLSAGGALAVQMPQSWGAPSHRLMRETLEDGGGRGRPFGDAALRARLAAPPVAEAAAYYDWLAPVVSRLDVWETEYLQALDGDDAVLEWVKGTGLRPVLDGLAGAERDAFLAEYAKRLRAAYPRRPDGRTLYPFRRLFLVAVR